MPPARKLRLGHFVVNHHFARMTPMEASTTAAQTEPGGRTRDSVARGTDLPPESRPGVPMDAEPHPAEGAHWQRPDRQRGSGERLHRAGLDRPTPVFGTAQPPRGASGLLRRAAYGIPEHYGRHWMLLMLADRVDVLEDRIGPTVAEPLRQAGLDGVADRVQRNPLAAIAGALVGGWVLKHLLD